MRQPSGRMSPGDSLLDVCPWELAYWTSVTGRQLTGCMLLGDSLQDVCCPETAHCAHVSSRQPPERMSPGVSLAGEGRPEEVDREVGVPKCHNASGGVRGVRRSRDKLNMFLLYFCFLFSSLSCWHPC